MYQKSHMVNNAYFHSLIQLIRHEKPRVKFKRVSRIRAPESEITDLYKQR